MERSSFVAAPAARISRFGYKLGTVSGLGPLVYPFGERVVELDPDVPLCFDSLLEELLYLSRPQFLHPMNGDDGNLL